MNELDNLIDELYQKLGCKNGKENDDYAVKISVPVKYGLFPEDTVLNKVTIKNLSVNIIIRTREGENYPHCHVIETSENNGKQFHCCVCLDQPKYFIHKGKEDTFNTKQRKEFNKIMRSHPKRGDKSTVWDILVRTWNKCNRKKVEVKEIPNYIKLSGCIREGEK